jgi:hypothetical protein
MVRLNWLALVSPNSEPYDALPDIIPPQRGRWQRIEPAQQKGLRDRNSPTCTLSQNGYGDSMSQRIIPCNLRTIMLG